MSSNAIDQHLARSRPSPPSEHLAPHDAVLVSVSRGRRWFALLAFLNGALLSISLWRVVPFTAEFVVSLVVLNLVMIRTAINHVRSRRRWVQITDAGFVVTDRRGTREFHDSDVSGISLELHLKSGLGDANTCTRTCRLSLETSGGRERIELVNTFPEGYPDPLDLLIRRVVKELYLRAKRLVERGGSFAGEGWVLERHSLRVSRGREVQEFPLSDLVVVDVHDNAVCIWKRGLAEPAIKIPLEAANAHVLKRFLSVQFAKRPETDAPHSSGHELGRVLFERRMSRSEIVLWSILLRGLSVGAVLFISSLINGLPIWTSALLSTALGTLFMLPLLLQPVSFCCHEFGIRQTRRLRREKRIRFEDLNVFTYIARRREQVYAQRQFKFIFVSYAPGHHERITYSTTRRSEDPELNHMWELACQSIASRMLADVRMGRNVVWTSNVRFVPGGVDYRTAGLLGLKPALFLGFGDVDRFEIIGGRLHVWAKDRKKPVFNADIEERNFYPGLLVFSAMQERHAEDSTPPAAKGALVLTRDELRGGT